MRLCVATLLRSTRAAVAVVAGLAMPLALAADSALLDVLLQNGSITQAQYDELKRSASTDPETVLRSVSESDVQTRTSVEEPAPNDLKASHGSQGFRLETHDGNWQTNLQWRAQFRYTNPSTIDPRRLSSFNDSSQSTIEARRLRMKIGGHGFQPWLKYYFEVDLQPSRDVDDGSSSSSARVIDYRLDVAKWDWGGLRVGQWKIDYNRERVDSSGRQQFVERSIVNLTFTIDRQVGVQLRGRANKNTRADLRWYAGVFTGEGRGVRNTDNNMMYAGRLQWNFLGRDVALRQTDVEFTELPSAALAFGAASTSGSCTRWSSLGCGNLDGFTSPGSAEVGQFDVDQWVQDFAYKHRGFSVQQEFHRKIVKDNVLGTENDLTGAYLQAGYFLHHRFPSVPAPLELAARYAYVEEPNATDRAFDNEREELSLAANWFFKGHNNKLTLDVSHLMLDDGFIGRSASENRVRLQWDVSF